MNQDPGGVHEFVGAEFVFLQVVVELFDVRSAVAEGGAWWLARSRRWLGFKSLAVLGAAASLSGLIRTGR